ncbi:hypothetical protein ALC57_15710 [Trachymyrmex cornetzi]|uniref:Uncharacterized protein n=1 Tax=Trachymyrmex cornetzi TaxID=471704 RepID=A0A151IWE9_9HYME|nr:hypothetical protein ALC57_15710 [Trachymyrmex cornetzi]
MRTEEESRRTSVALFCSVETLTHLVNIPSLLVETFPRFARQRQFVSAMISQGDLHVIRWTNIDSNFQILVACTRQIITSAHTFLTVRTSGYRKTDRFLVNCDVYSNTSKIEEGAGCPSLSKNLERVATPSKVSMIKLSLSSISASHSHFSRPSTYTRALLSSHSSAPITGLVKNSLSLCVRSAPTSNCTLVVAPEGIFIVSLAFFFHCYALSASVFMQSEIQSATLFHRAIVTLQLLELTSRGFAIRFIGEYLVRRVSIGEIVVPRIRNVVFSTRSVQRIYTSVTSG